MRRRRPAPTLAPRACCPPGLTGTSQRCEPSGEMRAGFATMQTGMTMIVGLLQDEDPDT